MELIEVKDYVQKTAEIIGSIAELEVLICDVQYRILGDSKGREQEQIPKVGAQSILTKVMSQGKAVMIEDVKSQADGCRHCQDRLDCDVVAIIAMPIARGIHVFGCIGIYAYQKGSIAKLVEKHSTFTEFIGRMAELLVAKLDEQQEKHSLQDRVKKLSNHASVVSFDEIVGSSQAIQKVKREAESIAVSSSTVLIQGESGTGKEIFSRAIHSRSRYCDGPFIAVNCAAIPDHLLESELFGYEEGAFTGAMKGGRIGKFEMANHGTLFLDEVAEVPIHLQSKLLRVLQERRIQKLGSGSETPVDIRILAATNRNLEDMMKEGAFREDLYYRLNVIPLFLPALRERREDILEFCSFFLERYNRVLGKELKGFAEEAKKILQGYDWPGNVRELQNTVEYAVNMAEGIDIKKCDLPARVLEQGGREPLKLQPLREVEEMYIREALRVYGTSLEGKEKAARILGVSRATLYRKLKEGRDSQS